MAASLLVYIHLAHRPLSGTKSNPTDFPSHYAFKALPELFYVPEEWSDTDKSEWDRLRPIHRLQLLNSRQGWVGAGVPVLPFAVEHQPSKLEKP